MAGHLGFGILPGMANLSSACSSHYRKLATKRRSIALNIFLARPGQQLDTTIEETLKTLTYQCHPALHLCVPGEGI